MFGCLCVRARHLDNVQSEFVVIHATFVSLSMISHVAL